ncbi:MAG: VCBS repeat-containing protein [Candidatus Stahlbacteria bacterium]|nr:VCBS repeat-containing protein [Candidatus Stahlbacteria bacterium]
MRHFIISVCLLLSYATAQSERTAILLPEGIGNKFPLEFNKDKGEDTLHPTWEGPYSTWASPYRIEYEATMLSVAFPCTVVAIGHGVLSRNVSASKPCSIFIWSDAGGNPGTVLYKARVTANNTNVDQIQFNWYPVVPPLCVTDNFWVGNYEMDTLYPTSVLDSVMSVPTKWSLNGTTWTDDKVDYLHAAVVRSDSIIIQNVTFTNVTTEAGVYKENNNQTEGWNFVDFNGDSLYDLVLTREGYLFKNNGDGTFTQVTSTWMLPFIISNWVDLDNDNDQDVVLVSGGTGRIRVYRNDGGTFTLMDTTQFLPVGSRDLLMSVASADYDTNGLVDFYISNYDNTQFGGQPDRLYKNNGDFSFTNVAGSAIPIDYSCGRGVVWGDYDNDGDADIYVSNYRLQANFLYRNNSNGTFTDVAGSAGVAGAWHTVGADFGDYNNDGWMDIIAPAIHGYPWLYKNNGNGTFTDATSQAGIYIQSEWAAGSFADYDNDGDLDILASKWYQGFYNVLFRNNGNGTFTDITSQTGISINDCPSVAWGDYNNDGWLDIWGNKYSGSGTTYHTFLYKNNGGLPHNWLEIELIGKKSNREGIGARVKIFAAGKMQIREVKAGSAHETQNMRRVHFGLGTSAVIDTLIVTWPSGIIDKLFALPANQIKWIEEGGAGVEENRHGLLSPSVFPIPSKGSVTFKTGNMKDNLTITIYDCAGRIVQKITATPKTKEIKFNNLKSGTYFYKAENNSFSRTGKFVAL